MNPLTLIPDAVRQVVYIVYSCAVIGVGAVQVGFVSANAAQPVWLTIALAVLAYLGGVLGITAASNVQKKTDA